MTTETPAEVLADITIKPTITREEAEACQHWAGMDGATAWHLIDRHAENWADVGLMMDAWLEANRSLAAGRVQHVALLDKKGDEVLCHSIPKFASELADGHYRLYTAPPADPAKASEPDMAPRGELACEDCGAREFGFYNKATATLFCRDCGQIAELCHEAINRPFAKASGSAPDGFPPFGPLLKSIAINCDLSECGEFDGRPMVDAVADAIAWCATPPASAPEVTEQVIERVAISIARRDLAPWFHGSAEDAWPHARGSTRDEYRVMARNAIDEYNAALQEKSRD